ncbi:hypothetical protein BDZ89DRAFT_1047141 [Hymenopellis radicata]|nr:hypothetical protein BDZ89DRAFT_1047141 [Hymenopellis radicata]
MPPPNSLITVGLWSFSQSASPLGIGNIYTGRRQPTAVVGGGCNRTREFGPNAPHLIVASRTILDQWICEARRFFKPGAVELIKVDTQGSKWANTLLRLDDGSYPDIRKNSVVQHSVRVRWV